MSMFLMDEEVEFKLRVYTVHHPCDPTPFKERMCTLVADSITRKGKPLAFTVEREFPLDYLLQSTFHHCHLVGDYLKRKGRPAQTQLTMNQNDSTFTIEVKTHDCYNESDYVWVTHAPCAESCHVLLFMLWEYINGAKELERLINEDKVTGLVDTLCPKLGDIVARVGSHDLLTEAFEENGEARRIIRDVLERKE